MQPTVTQPDDQTDDYVLPSRLGVHKLHLFCVTTSASVHYVALKLIKVTHDPPRRLRSSDADCLAEPVAWTATAERRFSYFVPRVWNALHPHVISADSLDSVKARLKTHLFDIV